MAEHLMQFPCGEPCQSCAVRKGAEANRRSQTMANFNECIESGEPFYCHEAVVGYPDYAGEVTRLCRGWVNAITARGTEVDIK